MMQRFFPIIFAYFYLIIPAAVVLYMIISTTIRIITQDLMFRTGVSNPNKGKNNVLAPGEPKEIPAIEESPPKVKPQAKPQSKPQTKPQAKSQPKPQVKPAANSRSKAKRKRRER
jgi:membrane protein insertase Oxa1/YidC/SpoIIIJ